MSFESPENPYQPPLDLIDDTSLTRMERKSLEFYLRYRDRSPTLSTMLSAYALRWILKVALVTALLALFSLVVGFSQMTTAVLLAGGIMFGSILQEIAHCRTLVILWPMLVQIFDWDKIDEKLHPPVTATPVTATPGTATTVDE